MKEIKLYKLILQNFQGGNFTLEASGTDTDIFGDNGTGKTRLASAFSWLLFDKDSLGRADFEIKNLDAQGEAKHGIEHSVEGVLSVDDIPSINAVTLKKIYRELWQKKRGSAQATFTGHTTDYFIDSVPVQKKDYIAKVAEIAGDESIFRLLTSPTVFPQLHWQKQRALLLEICGDMTDNEVILSDVKLSGLLEILGKRSIDDHRKIIAAKKTEINKELEKIPVRIDEVQRGLPDISGLDRIEIEKDVKKLETELNEAKLKLQGVDTGGELAELTKQIAVIDADLQKLESVHYSEATKTVNKLSELIAEIELNVTTDKNRVTNLEGDIIFKKRKINDFEQLLQGLRDQWAEIEAQTFQDTTEEKCPACGQALPSERVNEAREKAQAAFNLKKAKDLASIEQKSKELTDNSDRLKKEVNIAIAESESISETFAEVGAELEKLSIERNIIKKRSEDIPGREDLLIKKTDIEAQIKTEKEGHAQDTDKIREEIIFLENKQRNLKFSADKFTQRESGEKRIEDLKAKEKKLAAEYERLEKELYLTEQFIRTKVNLLTDRINSQFEITRFKLFDVQVNQAISECCEITVNGIPYFGGLNSGARTNAGLDVIRTLQRHYGIQPVVFIDNAESIVDLLPMEHCQVIRLVVSEKDRTLRVETTKKEAMV